MKDSFESTGSTSSKKGKFLFDLISKLDYFVSKTDLFSITKMVDFCRGDSVKAFVNIKLLECTHKVFEQLLVEKLNFVVDQSLTQFTVSFIGPQEKVDHLNEGGSIKLEWCNENNVFFIFSYVENLVRLCLNLTSTSSKYIRYSTSIQYWSLWFVR